VLAVRREDEKRTAHTSATPFLRGKEMSPVNWDACRRKDWSINLVAAAVQTGLHVSPEMRSYLETVEQIQPIKSRQVAAATIIAAQAFGMHAASSPIPKEK
jgi:hypothetical protein